MNQEAKKEESCCHDSGHRCCGGKKLILSVLLGFLLLGVGFYLGKSNFCPMGMSIITQQK